MALFGKKQNTKKVQTTAKSVPVPHESASVSHSSAFPKKHVGAVLLSPRITEKGTLLSSAGAYAFNVARGASKQEIARAVGAVYKVVPVKIRIVSIPSKTTRSRAGVAGKTARGRKAYVYLKKGDVIEVS